MADQTEDLTDDLGAVLHHAPDFIARLGADLRYRYVNARAEELTGVPGEDWIGRRISEWGFDTDATAPWRRAVEAALHTGERQEVMAPVEMQGRTLWFETRIVPEKDADGAVIGLVVAARDVSERMEGLRHLEETTRLLTRTVESLSEAVFVLDPARRVVLDCNPMAERMFGWRREELVGRSILWLHRGEEAHRLFEERSVGPLRRKGIYRGHLSMRRKDGVVFPTEHTVTLLDPRKGLEGGTVSVVRDRSEEVEAARALERTNRRLEALRGMDRALLAASAPDAVAAAAATHALEILGCRRASVTLVEEGGDGARLAAIRGAGADRVPEGTRVPVCPFPVGSLRPGVPHLVPDLERFPAPLPDALRSLTDAGLRALVTIPLGEGDQLLGALNLSFADPADLDGGVTDVAKEVAEHLGLGLRQIRLQRAVAEAARERLQAEERAHRVQVRLEELLDNLDVGFLRAALDGSILEGNEAARRIMGLEPDEPLVGRALQDVLWPGETWDGVLRQLRADGGDMGSIETTLQRPDGRATRVSALGRILEEADGTVVVEGVFEDVTEEMRLREEVVEISTRERLRIGQDLHDDLGQHLTGIAFLARDLARHLADEGLEEAAREAGHLERMANLAVKKTRHLARGVHPPSVEHRGLPGALEELAGDVEDLFALRVTLEVDEAPATASTVEATHLFRVAQEAITNAARHGGATAVTVSWARSGKHRVLSVVDDGSGFGTKDVEPGLGLGIMRYRARLLGGALGIRSTPGKGTEVQVSLPSASPAEIWQVGQERGPP